MTAIARAVIAYGLAGLIAWGSHVPAQAQSTFDTAKRQLSGDWVVECLAGRDPGPESCQLYQRILTQDPNTAALVVALVWLPDQGTLQLQAALPLGVDLQVPPELRVDGAVVETFMWSRCLKAGCMVEAPLSKAAFETLEQGQGAAFMVTVPNAGPIEIPVSLGGFRNGLAIISTTAADG
ncbi:invasion associated locus B family protein [Thalassobius sp. Cn5-15]|uniref:invasion associated locus B family protein n=1 Tax=Thalassobius sp. Cn5-15 TaxID=2917763 RepID=UPI001EF26FBB|nr:invasion associated locus B family protein [Thalassobius sp. Cn5-15]MCG7493165.1 invasion associated locus B family protein [Thalassobius sp. Cn5-15]